jgi:imidazolonepropionase
MTTNFLLRIQNATQLVCVCANKERFKTGESMNEIAIIENGTMIVNKDGLIADIGPAPVLREKYKDCSFEVDIDCTGKSVVPGLIDAHTHPVWSGDRVHEFAMKLAGATYMDIHKAGGGIGFTVEHTRKSSEQELEALFLERLRRMLRLGTTTIEAKSGYGLDLDTEIKLLRILHTAKYKTPMDIVATYCGAHSVPKGKTPSEATEDIVNCHIPTLKKLMDRGEISPDLIDVFCEKDVFEIEHARRILLAGKEIGLELNFHGDELSPIHAAELAGELNALAVSHLEHISEEGIKALAERPTFAVLLPTTAYLLKLKSPPTTRLKEHGVPIALGSDFNPNAHCLSMPLAMNMACVLFGLTLNQALVAATINAAGSLNKSTSHGSLEVGKVADFLVINSEKWEHLIYEMVDPPIQYVVKRGKVVYATN